MWKDEEGNAMFREGNNIMLKLLDHPKRLLGKLNFENGIISVYRDNTKHILRINNSYGFNYSMLIKSKSIKNIVIVTNDNEVYIVPTEFIFNNGEFLHFKKTGFEKQIFIGLDKIKQFKLEY